MPSLAAKTENGKISCADFADPGKQIMMMVEKRTRNLEKRKMKLDNYRQDVENGKELNEDQKMAVSKYDQVEGVLEFSRELSKAISGVLLDSARQQKKLAKKEQLERQQYEIQRLQEAFMFCHILSCFQNEDVRNDFLNGENGAIQLTSEQLSQLDQLYKLIGPGLPTEQADLSNHFHALAENHIFLVEGKNKEIVGTTYKVLKDLLLSIKECGYFSRPSSETVEEDETSSEDMPEEEIVKNEENPEILDATNGDDEQQPSDLCNAEPIINNAAVSVPVEEIPNNDIIQFPQTGPLQEVLSSQTAFNFLQESQIDLDAPHMDPAVVAVRPMAPPQPTSHNFVGSTYTVSPPIEEKPSVNIQENCDMSIQSPPINQIPMLPSAVPRTVAPVLSSVQLNNQQEFDPSHPIPTQTFTNQSFAVMQNMIMPPGYVPVTMHHAPHIAPIAVVPGLSTPVSSGASVVPIPVTVAPVSVSPANDDENELKISEIEETVKLPVDNNLTTEIESNSHHTSNEKNGENGYPSFRGGYRRGRGRTNNGYYRGRQNYNGRGGYQNNHYYQDRNGYRNDNYRRGNNRGGPRGGNGNNRGRGNYRAQASSQAPQQQEAQQ